jgi:MarR family transcriptional regulator, organic hydroperoxide resistance regulator
MPETPAVPELELDNQLCFLVYRLEHQILAIYRPILEKVGLTYPQYLVMLVVWQNGVASVGQIASALHLDTGTISPLLKRLETHGLILRQRDPVDERSVKVSLTEAGRVLREKARAVPKHLVRCLGLEPQSYLEVQSFLKKMLLMVDMAIPASGDNAGMT